MRERGVAETDEAAANSREANRDCESASAPALARQAGVTGSSPVPPMFSLAPLRGTGFARVALAFYEGGPWVKGWRGELIFLLRRCAAIGWWELAPVAQLFWGPSGGQARGGACRSKGLVVGEHVPDRFGLA